jgi:hypothetical protein
MGTWPVHGQGAAALETPVPDTWTLTHDPSFLAAQDEWNWSQLESIHSALHSIRRKHAEREFNVQVIGPEAPLEDEDEEEEEDPVSPPLARLPAPAASVPPDSH